MGLPSRIIKESICSSEQIAALNQAEEIFFYRLMVNCDDYGRIDARNTILRAKCFPLKLDSITDKDIEKWLYRLCAENLIQLYEINQERFLQITTWEKHQQVRNRRSKYPTPPADIKGPREHFLPEEKDIEDLLFLRLSENELMCGHKILNLDRQVRVMESYLDVVVKTDIETFVLELKRGRLSNKAAEQLIKYLALVPGCGLLIGNGVSANFDFELCKENNICVVTFDDEINFELVIPNSTVSTVNQVGFNVKSRFEMLAPNPIQSNPIQSNPNPIRIQPQNEYTDEFEIFWDEYPRKIEKKTAFKVWNTRINNKISPNEMIQAAKNYTIDCKTKKTETQFIKHPSTFIGPNEPFKEYINPPIKPPPTPEQITDNQVFMDKLIAEMGDTG